MTPSHLIWLFLLLPATIALAQDGPWNHRVLLATSPDGLTWTVQRETLAEKASVPELFLDPSGRPTLLFVDASTTPESVGALQQTGAAAGLAGWRRVATNLRDVDPNIVRLADGSFRAYLKSGLNGAMAAYRSADGLSWQSIGEVFRDSRYPNATDPDVFETPDGWVMLVSLGTRMLRCTSSDGLRFSTDGTTLDLGGSVSDTIKLPGGPATGWRTYFHVNANPQTGVKMRIRSAVTRDGKTWAVEEGDRVVAPNEGPASLGVADPAPILLPDGTWMMAIKSFIAPVAGITQPSPLPSGGIQNHQVLSATSADGLTWTRDPGVRIPQVSVPAAINDNDQRILIYFVQPPAEPGKPETVAVATSTDGMNFRREPEFQIEGLSTLKAVDPSILKDDDGKFRLYYLASNHPGDPAAGPNPHAIHLALSTDGIHFRETGPPVFEYPDLVDPDVFRAGDDWLMYVYAKDATVIARSTDGTRFTYEGRMSPPGWGTTAPLKLPDGRLRLYAFDQRTPAANAVRSFLSTDGIRWEEEPGERLRGNPGEQITDPFVIPWRGGYKMYFKSNASQSVTTGGGTGNAGGFTTAQPAGLVLGARNFNDSGGATLLNHPTGLATDGTALLLADRWNNRVLIWKSAPRGNLPPDLVLGQPGFDTNNSGQGKNQLNWPGNVAITPDGRRIAVADTNNQRILIWNQFPETNGTAADVEIDLTRLPQTQQPGLMPFGWPWGIWTDGRRLAVVATNGRAVLLWNALPTRDHQPPDFVFRPNGAGTPRNITSDGESFFALSDHNWGPDSRPGTMVWREVPSPSTSPDPAFVLPEWMKGTVLPEGKLVLAGIQNIFLWNSLPAATQLADLMLRPASYRNGDGPDAVVALGRLYVCNYNGNNVLGWDSVPKSADQQPDFSIGSDSPAQDTWAENFFIQNPALAVDGNSLFASSDFDRKLFVWRTLPTASGTPPDAVIPLPEAPWDSAASDSRLVLAGKRAVMIWSKLPLQGEPPETIFNGRIGDVPFQELTGAALDSRYLYLADRQANRIYIWEGLPAANQSPKWVLDMQNPGRISSDGVYLTAAPFEGQEIFVWKVSELASGNLQPARVGGNGMFNLPGDAIAAKGRLFVADRSNNRVQAWARIEDALAGKPADAYLGARNPNDRSSGLSPDKLYMPGSLAYDGVNLWVGEFKFSTRILRFSPQ